MYSNVMTEAVIPRGFPVRQGTTDLDEEALYLNSLHYVKVGTNQVLVNERTGKRVGIYRVTGVDEECRRLTTAPFSHFGYCNDGKWRQLIQKAGSGGTEARGGSFLRVPTAIHPHAWTTFVPHAPKASELRTLDRAPTRLTREGDLDTATKIRAEDAPQVLKQQEVQRSLDVHGSILDLHAAASVAARLEFESQE